MEIKVVDIFHFFTSYKDLENRGIYLTEGKQLQAKVVGKFGSDYIIHFNGYNFLAESNIELTLGKVLSLFVKEIKNGKILLQLINEQSSLHLLSINNIFTKYMLQGLPLLGSQLQELSSQLIITNNKPLLLLLSSILLKDPDLVNINFLKNFINELLADNYFSLKKVLSILKDNVTNKNVKLLIDKIMNNIDTQILQNSIFIKNKVIPFYMQLPIYIDDKWHNVELKVYQRMKHKKYDKKNFNISLLFSNLSLGYLQIILTNMYEHKLYIKIYTENEETKYFINENIPLLKDNLEGIEEITVSVKKNLIKDAILFRLPEEFYDRKLSMIDLRV